MRATLVETSAVTTPLPKRLDGGVRSLVIPPADGREDAPTIVFLHGRGLGPQTVSNVRRAFPTARIVAPEGGVALKRGHTWFQNAQIGIAQPESVAEATRRFMRWFDGPVIGGRKVWLCGFSNGGAFAASLLMAHPDRFSGAALLSAPLVLPPWPAGRLAGKPVFYAHGGTQDEVVPQDMFEVAAAYLDGASGALVTLKIYDIGHIVADNEVSDLAAWFARVAVSV